MQGQQNISIVVFMKGTECTQVTLY